MSLLLLERGRVLSLICKSNDRVRCMVFSIGPQRFLSGKRRVDPRTAYAHGPYLRVGGLGFIVKYY